MRVCHFRVCRNSFSWSHDGIMTDSMQRIEIVTRSVRRRWTEEQKLEIVRQTLRPGASVGMVARRHGLAPSQLYDWRKHALTGAMSGFVPIEVAEVTPMIEPPQSAGPDSKPESATGGMIEVDLPNGCRIRVSGDVDGAALKQVFATVSGLRT